MSTPESGLVPARTVPLILIPVTVCVPLKLTPATAAETTVTGDEAGVKAVAGEAGSRRVSAGRFGKGVGAAGIGEGRGV